MMIWLTCRDVFSPRKPPGGILLRNQRADPWILRGNIWTTLFRVGKQIGSQWRIYIPADLGNPVSHNMVKYTITECFNTVTTVTATDWPVICLCLPTRQGYIFFKRYEHIILWSCCSVHLCLHSLWFQNSSRPSSSKDLGYILLSTNSGLWA